MIVLLVCRNASQYGVVTSSILANELFDQDFTHNDRNS